MFKILLTTLILSSTAIAEIKMDKVLDTFNDKVKMLKESEDGIKLHFETHAAFYKVNKMNPNFEQFKKTIERSIDENKEVRVIVEIPSMEITNIDY